MEHLPKELILTLSMSIMGGGLLMVAARKLRFPGIVLLLLGGVCMGPEGVGLVQPDALGDMLGVVVSLAVGLILFEGGLTLNVQGFRTEARMISRLLSIGVVVTWLGTAGVIWLLYDFEPSFSLLAGSLVIVTGPTVIQPLLKRIRLKWNVHNILHWEGVLNDPIGVFIAVLMFEWVVGGEGGSALFNLFLRLVAGLAVGVAGGELIHRALKWKLVAEDMVNVFTIACALLIFGVTEMIIAEGGLLSVTVAGLLVGYRQPEQIRSIKDFKATITDLLIGMLFILLTARLEFAQFYEFGLRGLVLVLALMFVVRPLAVFASGWRSNLTSREKMFLGWVAPRGVVAASIASLFGIVLSSQGQNAEAAFLESFVYSVIFLTVILQGFSAGPLAYVLRLKQAQPEGWLVVGAHAFGRRVAAYLRDHAKVPVVLCDGNRKAVNEAREQGFSGFFGDARDVAGIERRPDMTRVGNLLALTDNEDLNELLCAKWSEAFGKERVYRWSAGKSDLSMDRRSSGRTVWSWLPKPSMLSTELMLDEAAILEIEGDTVVQQGSLSTLLVATEKQVLIDPENQRKVKAASKQPVTALCLQREADYLLAALHPSLIVRLETRDKMEILTKLTRMAADFAQDVDGEAALQSVLERETALATSLGHGVSVPHAHVPGLRRTICAIGQVPNGFPAGGEDEEPIRLVFLLLSPPTEPENHLAVLGEIARLCKNDRVRRHLMETPNADEILGIIREHRRLHTAFGG